jgi:uncharacterized membrane protein
MKPTEFFRRWKHGIMLITPWQQTWISLMGTLIVVFGVVSGIMINTIKWLDIVLIGSLILTLLSLLGVIQKLIQLAQFRELERGIEQNEINKEQTRTGD